MEEAIKKADALIEALPYLQKFHRKVIVVKYGGSAVEDPQIRKRILQDLVFLNIVGIGCVLVHGGGPSITQKMRKCGMKVEFVGGLRATDKRAMKIVDDILSALNEKIVNELKTLGAKAHGLLSKRDEVVLAKKKKAGKADLGHTGAIESVNVSPIKKALKAGAVPVLSPVGIGADKKLYNVNADEVAAKVASALDAEKLVLLTNVRGIMADKEDASSTLSTLTAAQAKDLIKRNIINTGMIPKVDAAISALEGGVRKVHIIDWKLPHSILLEIFTDKGVGTEIVRA